jgi:hypothetical protein
MLCSLLYTDYMYTCETSYYAIAVGTDTVSQQLGDYTKPFSMHALKLAV